MDADHAAIARSTLLVRSCPEDVAEEILSRARLRSFSQGETIFEAGAPADTIYIVASGWVKLFRTTRGGAEAVVGVFTKGQSIADAAALQADNYPVSAEAATRCDLIAVSARHLIDLMLRRPETCLAVLSSTLFHLRTLVAQVESLKALNGAQRTAQFLLSLVPPGGSVDCEIELPHNKLLIAGRLGITPESLSRALGRLRRIGVRTDGNTVTVADVEALTRYSEGGGPGSD